MPCRAKLDLQLADFDLLVKVDGLKQLQTGQRFFFRIQRQGRAVAAEFFRLA